MTQDGIRSAALVAAVLLLGIGQFAFFAVPLCSSSHPLRAISTDAYQR
jgi:hypothetical protein